jgi:hypothetical protein
LPMLLKFAPGAQQVGILAAHEGETFPVHIALGNLLPIEFHELGLVVKELKL